MLIESLVGIVTGIMTTWILYFGKVIFDTKVTPYLRETRYQGVKIEGAWSGASDENNIQSESRLFLNQSAHELTGSFTLKHKDQNGSFTIDFNVRGYMWEGYITLNFIPKDRRITSYATALMKLHNGGVLLIGQWCLRNVQKEQVEAWPISLSRDAKQS